MASGDLNEKAPALAGGTGRNRELIESSGNAAGATSPDRAAILDFLRLWPHDGHVALTAIAPDRRAIETRSFRPDALEAAADWAVEQNAAKGRNVYFSTAQLLRPVAKKAAREDVAAVPALLVDIDCRAGEPVAEELRRIAALLADEAELRRRGLPGLPTLVVCSGGGYWAFWFLAEPAEVGGDLARAEAVAARNLAIAQALDGDACHNVDRIARLPGTVNRPDAKKRAKGRTEALAHVEAHDPSRVYELAQFPEARTAAAARAITAPTSVGDHVERVSGMDDPRLARVSDRAKVVIVHGHDPEEPDRHPSRSEWLFFVCCEMVRAGCDDETIYAVITDPGWAISASVRDKADPHKYALRQIEQARRHAKPRIQLPGGTRQHRDTALDLVEPMRRSGWYQRGGALFFLSPEGELEVIRPARAVTEFERVADFYVVKFDKQGNAHEVPATLYERAVKVFMEAAEFVAAMPEIKVIADCAVLVEQDGALVEVVGYDESTGILARGEAPERMGWEDGRDALLNLLRDYDFADEADRARLLAAILTPALNIGRMLGNGRVPILVLEADSSQAGKGLAVRCIAILYGSRPQVVNQKGGGVGSLRESIDDAILRGKPFISLDNIRGRVDVPALESALTEPLIQCRVPYRGNVAVDPRGVNFMLTSNNAELTPDLANRSNIVRIRKRPESYQFYPWPEGSLEEHIEANQTRYLGAVWAILREWHRRGKPLAEDDGGHDFRRWARAVRYIVRDLLEVGDPITGAREIQRRTANPGLAWLREVVVAARKDNRLHEDLRAADLLDLAIEHEIPLPGPAAEGDEDDEAFRGAALRAVGRRLASVFRQAESVEIDGLLVQRRTSETPNEHGRYDKTYRIVPVGWEGAEPPF